MQAVLEKIVSERKWHDKVFVDSCGINPSFLGSTPDRRMQEVAFLHGVSIHHRAKGFEESFFDQFDYILAATHDICKILNHPKCIISTEFSKKYFNKDIPDPYLDQLGGFEKSFEMISDAMQSFASHLEKKHHLQ